MVNLLTLWQLFSVVTGFRKSKRFPKQKEAWNLTSASARAFYNVVTKINNQNQTEQRDNTA
jgi:hypothetical protein